MAPAVALAAGVAAAAEEAAENPSVVAEAGVAASAEEAAETAPVVAEARPCTVLLVQAFLVEAG